MTAGSKSVRFQAIIYKIWMMRHVDLPEAIGRALERESGKKKHIPVVAAVGGRSTRTSLVPAGGGRYRLQINAALRKAAGGADAGDMIGVALQFDGAPREIPVPPELSAVLKDHPKARKEFERLPPGHRRQLLLYYLCAKSPRARQNVTVKFIDHLLERTLLRSAARKRPPGGKARHQV
jgi:Bacteriocin-protection, YdeI or OmpD-Associated/Domain of unknown function (DUF1905)